LTVCIYLAHLNPVTNAHVEIIDELKKESDIIVMPVIFRKNDEEVNSRSFPFSFEIRKQMLDAIFGDSIKVSKNYTFNAPFRRYLPPLISPYSWVLRKQILTGIPDDYFTYTGDKAEGLMLKAYRLNPKIGIRKTISATSVKNKMYDAALGEKISWEEDIPSKVVEIIKQHWNIVEKYAKLEDETTRVIGMKFPKDGYWSK
jgi:nicotinamide mononucleotide adenylyltransferase